jgi:hypothetical protein
MTIRAAVPALAARFALVAASTDTCLRVQTLARTLPVGKAPTIFPGVLPLMSASFGDYPAFVPVDFAVHRGNTVIILLGGDPTVKTIRNKSARSRAAIKACSGQPARNRVEQVSAGFHS